MTHDDAKYPGHMGPPGSEADRNSWAYGYDDWAAANPGAFPKANPSDTPKDASQVINEFTYQDYLSAMGRYGTEWQLEKEKDWQSLVDYWSRAANTNFLIQYGPDDELYLRDGQGGYKKLERYQIAVYYGAVQANKVLSGELQNPFSEVETEVKSEPYQLIVRVMKQTSDANGNTYSTPEDVIVQLNEDQYNLLLQSPIWGEYGVIDETKKRITTHVNNWWDLRELMKDPAKMGLDSVAVGDETDPNFDPTAVDAGLLTGILNAAQGMVEASNPLNPRDSGLPSIPPEYAKTGITWSIDPVTGTKELVDTMPWVGPPAGSLRWVPLNPADDPMGAGSWQVDREAELSLQQTMWEGVPAGVRPWLQAVLNAGGDLNIINSALPEKLRNALTAEDQAAAMAGLTNEEQLQLDQHNVLRTWVGFILGQARASSDPEFGSPFVKDQFENWIPMGVGETAGFMKEFDQLLPNFLPSLNIGDAMLRDEKVTEKGLGKDKPPAKNLPPKKDDAPPAGSGDDGGNGDNQGAGPVPDGDGGAATGEKDRTVVHSHNNPDGTATIFWSDGTTTTVGTPRVDTWAGDTQSSAGGIPIQTVDSSTSNIMPGTKLPPHLIGDSAGLKNDTKPVVAKEIGGNGVIGDTGSGGDSFEGWGTTGSEEGKANAGYTPPADTALGTGELGGGTGTSTSGAATGTVAAAIAAQKARDEAAAKAAAAAKAEEERKRIEAAYSGGGI